MENTNLVFFSSSIEEGPVAVRMLLFNNAVQLYDVTGQFFLLSIPFNEIKLIERAEDRIRFAILPDQVKILDVPANHNFLNELLIRSGNSNGRKFGGFKRFRIPAIGALILILIIAGFYFVVPAIAGFGIQFISPKKEAELGKVIYNSTVESEKTDTQLTRLLQQFASRLQLSKQYKINITVIDTAEINAYALPGGNIIICRGILQEMKGYEELVALLGHESTHINERHTLRNILQEMTGTMVLSMVFGDFGNIGHSIASEANLLTSLSYSRRLEEEADALGMQLMVDNSVNPKGMVFLMDRLKTVEKGPVGPEFLNTHPVTSSRKKKAEAFVAGHPFAAGPREDLEISWNAIKHAILNKEGW